MSNTNTGGPAFPCDLTAYDSEVQQEMGGMTLRDYFAAKAMQAGIARNGFYDDENQFADWCYETADEMLKARNG